MVSETTTAQRSTKSLKAEMTKLYSQYGAVLILEAVIAVLRDHIPASYPVRASHPHAWASHYCRLAQCAVRLLK